MVPETEYYYTTKRKKISQMPSAKVMYIIMPRRVESGRCQMLFGVCRYLAP